MAVDRETEIKYNQIVGTIMQNVLAERNIANKIVLWDFQESQPMDRLYFNVASIVADMGKERMYIQMPLFAYLKMKWKRRKTRKNLRWCGPLMSKKLPDKAKTSVYIIVDCVREYYNESYDIFEKINNEFYGWC